MSTMKCSRKKGSNDGRNPPRWGLTSLIWKSSQVEDDDRISRQEWSDGLPLLAQAGGH